jgi:CheY-like chemotaxis protein
MALKDYRYLVVDDHILTRHIVNSALSFNGATVVDYAPDGLQGIEKMKAAHTAATPYHVIFLDWNMPKFSGLETLIECRKDQRFAKTAIVMLTSNSDDANIATALEAGATAYITKPFRPEDFISNLDNVIVWLNKMNG